MSLALAVGDQQELALGKPFGLGQYGSCDRDLVVQREQSDHVGWCVYDRCQPLGQSGARGGVHAVQEARHDVAKQADLLRRIARGAVDKEIGDAIEDIGAAGGAARNEHRL